MMRKQKYRQIATVIDLTTRLTGEILEEDINHVALIKRT